MKDPVRESRYRGKGESHSSSGEEEAAYPQAVLDPRGISRRKPLGDSHFISRWGSGPPMM